MFKRQIPFNVVLSRFPLLFLCFGMLGWQSCSSPKVDSALAPTELYKEAEEDIEASRFILALEKLREVKNKYPYSSEASVATLRIGDVYFLQESYLEAAAQYEAFKDLYPKSDKIEYAQYRQGLSYYEDLPENIARDLSSSVRAEESFRQYIRQFSGGEHLSDAEKMLLKTRNKRAEKELYIARFYIKTKEWEAAKGRLEKIISEYSDTIYFDEATKLLQKVTEKTEGKTS